MRITDLKPYKSEYVKIYLNGEYFRTISREVLIKSRLKVGSDADECTLRRVVAESEEYRAKNKAMNLLSGRAHSRKELETKLSKTIDKELIKSVSDNMEKLGFIDDEKFAEAYADELFSRKRYGKNRIKIELVKKGIDNQIIEKVIDDLDGDELENMRSIIEKKYLSCDFNDSKIYRKIVCFLQRYGYQLDDIIRIINDFKESSQYGEES